MRLIQKFSLHFINNTLIKVSSVEEGNTKTVTFDRTPIMSSYLVAVVVGEFDYVESKTCDGISGMIRTFCCIISGCSTNFDNIIELCFCCASEKSVSLLFFLFDFQVMYVIRL